MGEKRISFEKLDKMEAKGNVKGLIKALKKYHSASVAEALGRMNAYEAIDALIDALSYREHEVKESASQALYKMGATDPRMVEPLISMVEEYHTEYNYYADAIRLLGEIGDLRAVKPLKKLPKHGNITLDVDYALRKLRMAKQETMKKYRAFVNENKDNKYKKADSIKGKVDLEKASLFLKHLPESEAEISNAEKMFKDPKIIESVIEGLKAPDESIRYRAVLACEYIEDKRVIKPLIPLLKDNEKSVRELVPQLLGIKRERRAVKHLIEVMKDNNEDDFIRQRTADALEKIGTKEALDAIEKYWI